MEQTRANLLRVTDIVAESRSSSSSLGASAKGRALQEVPRPRPPPKTSNLVGGHRFWVCARGHLLRCA